MHLLCGNCVFACLSPLDCGLFESKGWALYPCRQRGQAHAVGAWEAEGRWKCLVLVKENRYYSDSLLCLSLFYPSKVELNFNLIILEFVHVSWGCHTWWKEKSLTGVTLHFLLLLNSTQQSDGRSPVSIVCVVLWGFRQERERRAVWHGGEKCSLSTSSGSCEEQVRDWTLSS